VGIIALTPELATLEDLFFRLTEGARDGRPGGLDKPGREQPHAATVGEEI
jgi:hypothetical protein